MGAEQFRILLRHTLADHRDHLNMWIVQRFHPALPGTIRADIDKARIDGRMILRRFSYCLVDGDRNQTAAVGNLIGLADVGRVNERLNVEWALDQITELRHAPGGVDTCRTP